MSAPLLAIDRVHAGYQSGVDILQGVSLGVASGSVTLVIGPNGAGKSTLLKTVFGFLAPHRGHIRFDDAEIGGSAPHRIKNLAISYLAQEINTFPLLTVEENLRMGGWVFRRDKQRVRAQIDRIYAAFPVLAERRRQPAGVLSGGQGRMLSVAREMMTAPKLLLVDEPTAGLSPVLVDQVYSLLQTARASLGATLLLVDQNVEAAVAQSDFVYMLNLGRIKAEGPAAEFGPARLRELIQECLLG
jgi:ABC-type branched-subunit amino acid transport system ATPase component